MKLRYVLLLLVLVIIGGVIYYIERPVVMQMDSGEMMMLGATDSNARAVVGEQAPDFTLMDYEGNIHHMSDFEGKYAVLNFWATWCPFCINEMPEFDRVYQKYRAQGLELVGVNRGESLESAKEYSTDLGISYTLLLNQGDDVAGAYNVIAMPSTFFIDKEGKIVSVKRGPLSEADFEMKLIELFGFGSEAGEIIMGGMEEGGTDSTEEIMELHANDDADAMEEVMEERGEAMKDDGGAMEESDSSPTVSVEQRIKTDRTITVTDNVKHSVPLSDIRGGGPPKDGIPSIDNPKFVTVSEANEYLNDEGLGIAVSFNGIDRFYPHQITVWHEIMNDNVGGQDVLVTYCPLCGTGTVFEPLVRGEFSEFGTSGKLWNSNLIMYDRKTDSYWSQAIGEAIVGELTGARLQLLPHDNVTWASWKKDHPTGEVLSQDTGYFRDYTRSPYGDYDTNSAIYFPVDNSDDRYHEKEPTFSIEVNNVVKIYPIEELNRAESSFRDRVANVDIDVEYNQTNETISFHTVNGNNEIVPFYGFWFSVIAVHPDAEVFTAE